MDQYIEESATGKLKLKVDEIVMKNKNKSAIMNKIKEMDKKYGEEGSKEYEKKDTLNALISCCFALPSISATGIVLSSGPASGFYVIGIPIGIVGLYLSGLLHEKKKRKYSKQSLLTHTKSKVEKHLDKLEKAYNKEKDAKLKKEMENRIKDAKATIKYCDKEINKIRRAKGEIGGGIKSSSSFDDIDLDDFDIDMDLDFDDWSLDESAMVYTETVDKSKAKPVYIVTIEGNSFISKPIKQVTNSIYTHAGLAFEPSLSKIYSYGGKLNSISKRALGGFTIDSIDSYVDDTNNGSIKVNAIFVNNEDYNRIKSKVDYLSKNADKTTYDFFGLVDVILNRAKASADYTKMICSGFVDSMLKMIDVDITGSDTSSNLVTPAMISKINNPKVYTVYEGPVIDYDDNVVKSRISKLYKKGNVIKESTMLYEVKSLGVQFNDEGDLVLKNPKSINFKAEHARSKKLYPIYKKNNNLNGMEYEACKLWYMNLILLKKIEVTRDKKKKEELYDIRAKILNEFTLYVNEITRVEPAFNFEQYYQATPFGEETIKINGSTIKYSMEYLKMLI